MNLGIVQVSFGTLLLLIELCLVEEDVGVELLGVFLPKINLPLLFLFHLLLQGHPFVLDGIQRAIVLDLPSDGDSELLLIVLDVAFQIGFGHDFTELLLGLAILTLQLHAVLAPNHHINIFKLSDQNISWTTI